MRPRVQSKMVKRAKTAPRAPHVLSRKVPKAKRA